MKPISVKLATAVNPMAAQPEYYIQRTEQLEPFQVAPVLHPKYLSGNEGYIYIAEIPATGHIKVGRSKTPTKRIKHFDTIMPVEVRIMAWFYADDCIAAEAWLHNYLKEYRVKGEWFGIPEMVMYNLLNAFCYIDGIFHMTQDINKDCCEQAVYDFVKDATESGELLRAVDYLPY